MKSIFLRIAAGIILLASGWLGAGLLCGQSTTAQTKPAVNDEKIAAAGIRAERDLKYGEATGKANLLDIYMPVKAEGKLPLVIWIHGGGAEQGDKKDCPLQFLVAKGYIGASLNYRFSREALYPAQLEDCKGAIRWLRAHAGQYHIDSDHIGVWGASAGGHFAALLGTTGGVKGEEGKVGANLDQSSSVQAVCDFFGPTDMSHFAEQAAKDENMNKALEKATRDPKMKAAMEQMGKDAVVEMVLANSPLSRLFGGPLDEHKELVARANPIAFISKDTPPFLIMHGDKDAIVPVAQSQMLYDALQKAKVESTLVIMPGMGHGAGFDNAGVRQTVAAFFDKHLK